MSGRLLGTNMGRRWSARSGRLVRVVDLRHCKLGASNHLEKPKSSPFPTVQVWSLNKIRSKYLILISPSRMEGWISPTNWVDFPHKPRDVAWRISKRCDEGWGAGCRWIRNFKTEGSGWPWSCLKLRQILKVFYHDCLSLHLKLTRQGLVMMLSQFI